MAWNTPRTWSVNEKLTAANMNTYISDDLSWLGISRPHGRVGDASFSHNSSGNWLTPSWDSISTNVGGGFATGTGYFTAPVAGFYLLGAGATFSSDATGARAIMLSSAANGGGTVYAQNFSPSQSLAIGSAVTTGVQLSAFQVVYASLLQQSGGTLAISSVNMWAQWETV